MNKPTDRMPLFTAPVHVDRPQHAPQTPRQGAQPKPWAKAVLDTGPL